MITSAKPVSISVVLPVYKGAPFLREAIESILSQPFTNLELIIVNDASPDDSETIISQFSDQRIIYLKHEYNKGLVAALNTGLDAAKGVYIARMDQDDVTLPDRLIRQYEFMEAHPEYVLCGTEVRILGNGLVKRIPYSDPEIRLQLLLGTPFYHPTVMIRRAVLEEHKLRYSEYCRHAEDYGLWVTLATYGKMINLSFVGLEYRLHEGQYTQVFRSETWEVIYREAMNYMRQAGINLDNSVAITYRQLLTKELQPGQPDALSSLRNFLPKWEQALLHTVIPAPVIHQFLASLWLRFCAEYRKQTPLAYFHFLRSRYAFRPFSIRKHLWFLKPST